MQAEADTEIGDLPLAGEFRRLDLAFRPPLPKAAGDQDAVNVVEGVDDIVVIIEKGRFNRNLIRTLDVIGDPAVDRGLR